MKLRQKLAAVMAAAMVVTAVPVVTMADTTNSVANTVNVAKDETMGFHVKEDTVSETTTYSVYTINGGNVDYKYRYIPTLELRPTGTYDLTGTQEAFFVDITNAKFSNEAFLAKIAGTKIALNKEGKIVSNTLLTEPDSDHNRSWIGKTPEELVKTEELYLDLNGNKVSAAAAKIVVKKVSDTQLRVTVKNIRVTKDDVIKVELFAKATGGDVTVNIDGSECFVSTGSCVVGTNAESTKKVTATVSKEAAISVDGGEIDNIVLTEQVLKAFSEAKDNTIQIALPASSDLEFRLENDAIKGDGGRGFAGKEDISMPAEYVNNDKQIIKVTIDQDEWKDPNARGTITLKGIKVVPQNQVAAAGDVTVKVTSPKEELMADTTLTVGKVSDYAVAIACKEPAELTAGKKSQTVEFTVKEAVADTIVDGRRAEFAIENGFIAVRDLKEDATNSTVLKEEDKYSTALETFTRLVKEEKIKLPEKVKLEDIIEVKANKEGQITGFVVEFNHLDTKANELTFKMPIMADLNTTGEVKLSVSGRALPQTIETTIAQVTAPVTVTTEAVQLKVGLNGQKGGKIVITETAEKMLNRGEMTITIPEATGISFVKDQELAVKAEGLTVKDVKVTGSQITFNVSRTSEKAGSITIEGIEFNVNRTTPEGKFELKMAGEALSTNEYIKAGLDSIKVADFITISTANTEDLTANGLKKGTASFKIESNKYTVNGVEKEMDGVAFLSNGRTMVPVRYVSEAFGIDGNNVLFNKGVVTLMAGNRIVQLTNGSNVALVNGVSITMDEKVTIKDGRTYIPMGEIGRLLGVNVTWDNETKTATFKN